jgi:serine carboxypeptidase-like clade 2
VQQSIEWEICTALNYNRDTSTVLPIYRNLIAKNLKVLIYSGDADGAVPFIGSELWTTSLGLPLNDLWREWLIPKDDGSQVQKKFLEIS